MPRRTTVVTVEKMHDGNLLDDPTLAAGTLPGFYVEPSRWRERGAWPLPLPDHYRLGRRAPDEYAQLPRPTRASPYLDQSSCMKPLTSAA